MDIKEISDALQKGGKIIFSPEPEAIHHIWADIPNKSVGFSIDNQDYTEKS